MTFEIRVDFYDKYGTIISEVLEITPPDSIDEDSMENYLIDCANNWFYKTCRKIFNSIWIGKGGGTYDEYEIEFEDYLEKTKFYIDWED